MTTHLREKYVNPYTDFGFKKLFGTEMNKELLISFINSLLKGEEEIRDFYESHPFSLNSRTSWEVQPDLDSETAGTLSASTVNEALNALNFVRFIAGLYN